MGLSKIQYDILTDMIEGWVLVQGKVLPGRPDVYMLRKMKDGIINEVQTLSTTSCKSLEKNGLIQQVAIDDVSAHNDTVIYYIITTKGKKSLKK